MKTSIMYAMMSLLLLICLSVWTEPVHATVYKSTRLELSPTESIDAGLEGPDSGSRKYILNGHRINGRIAYSDYYPSDLTSILAKDWEGKANKVFLGDDTDVPGMSIVRPIVSTGDNWSMFANLNLLGVPESAINVPTIAEKYIVFSARPSHKDQSDVWVLKIPADVSPLKLMVPASSGGDVPAYPGSEISWSLVEASGLNESELHVYSSFGSIDEHFAHYKKSYIERGYRYEELIENELGAQLLFSRGNSELDITLQREVKGEQKVVTIVQLRKKR